jgi:hypothetical protein
MTKEVIVYITTVALTATGEAAEVKARIISGQVKAGMFLRIPLNGSLDVTAHIGAVTAEDNQDVLLLLDGGAEWAEILIALNFADEELYVTEDGEW